MTNTTNATEMDVRFYFNGVRINGVMFLCYVWGYATEAPVHKVAGPYVAISLQGYDHFPAEFRKLVFVTNHSDYQTDYHDHDRFEVRPGSPFWPGARAAALKAKEREILRRERRVAKGASAYERGELESARKALEAFRLSPAE